MKRCLERVKIVKNGGLGGFFAILTLIGAMTSMIDFYFLSVFLISNALYLDLFKATIFQEIFKQLSLEEKKTVHEKLFSFSWNKPTIYNNHTKVRRYADIIGIGSKKCGTGAFRKFLIQHPAVAKYHATEAHFFDKAEVFEKGLEYYKVVCGNVHIKSTLSGHGHLVIFTQIYDIVFFKTTSCT